MEKSDSAPNAPDAPGDPSMERLGKVVFGLVLFVLVMQMTLRLLMGGDDPGLGNGSGLGMNLFVSIMGWLAFALILAEKFVAGRSDVAVGKLEISALALVGAMILSGTFAGHKFAAWSEAALWIGNIVLFYAAMNVLAGFAAGPDRPGASHEKRVSSIVADVMLGALFAMTVVLSLYAVCQVMIILPQVRERVLLDPGMIRHIQGDEMQEFRNRMNTNEAFSTFVNQNSFAGFLIIVIPVMLGFILQSLREGGRKQAVLFVAPLAAFVALMLTGSKGGWIGCACGMGLFLLVFFRPQIARFGHVITGLVLAGILALMVFAMAGGPGRMNVAPRSSLGVRMGYWSGAAEVVRHNPVTGVGLNNFEDHYPRYKTDVAGETKRAHNEFLDILTELGPLGLAGFVGVWLTVLYLGLKGAGSERVAALRAPPPSSRAAVEPPKAFLEKLNDRLGEIPLGRGKTMFGWLAVLGAAVAFFMNNELESALQVGTGTWGMLSPWMFFLVWLVAFAAFAGFGLFERAKDLRWLCLGVACGVLGFLVHAALDFDFHVPGISLVLWVLAAFAVVLAHHQTGRPILRLNAGKFAMGGFTIAVLGGVVWMAVGVLPGLLEADRIKDDLRHRQVSYDEKIELLSKAVTANPRDFDLHQELAIALHGRCLGALLNNWEIDAPGKFASLTESCSDALRRAIAIAPDKNSLHFLAGQIQEDHYKLWTDMKKQHETIIAEALKEEQTDETRRSIEQYRGEIARIDSAGDAALSRAMLEFQTARDLYPTRAMTRYRYGRILEKLGEKGKATAEYRAALDLSSKTDLVRLQLGPDIEEEILKKLEEWARPPAK